MELTLTVPAAVSTPVRLDSFVASSSCCADMSRSHLKATVQRIFINGRPAKLSSPVQAGDRLFIVWAEQIPDAVIPEAIPLRIIYEDGAVTVVNKAAGMVTHPAPGNWHGTLANALLARWGGLSVAATATDSPGGLPRPGIVHRLDKDTTGVIITARTAAATAWLQNQFKARTVRKEYIALVAGKPPARSGDIRTWIVRDPRNRKRFTAKSTGGQGKYARTLYHCIACYGPYSVIRLRIKTGRTHQIRVHLKQLGCPIVGDTLYGKKDARFPDAPLMLHARLLRIRLPGRTAFTTFRAAIPPQFLAVYRAVRTLFPRIEMPKTAIPPSRRYS